MNSNKLPLILTILISVVSCANQEPPIITSATYQHTLYNGQPQPIDVKAAKDAAPFVITYFRSEDDLWNNNEGTTEVPSEVGAYYARVERPAGKGYKEGKPIKVEYYIQKTFVPIEAEPKQEFDYDGTPKAALVRSPVRLVITYYNETAPLVPLAAPPINRGHYRAAISYSGDNRYMGASKDIELIIK
ncbi:hypothetical protein AGMMS50212_13120 [Spirochaetia bacterium]|nr:hypothetical protein AGMMS50212_13120 [Spirochaetia bacterium]